MRGALCPHALLDRFIISKKITHHTLLTHGVQEGLSAQEEIGVVSTLI